jgi:hypothetical protein
MAKLPEDDIGDVSEITKRALSNRKQYDFYQASSRVISINFVIKHARHVWILPKRLDSCDFAPMGPL